MNSFDSTISILFKKYYNKTASPQEIRNLFDLLNSCSDVELEELIRKEWEDQENEDSIFSLEMSENILKNILSEEKDDQAQTEDSVFKRNFRWPIFYRSLSAAAAIIILLSIGLYFRSSLNSNPGNQIASVQIDQDALPGVNKAVLILGNGRKIILDSLSNGLVAKTENFEVKKTDNGELVYNGFGRNHKNALSEDFNTLITPRGGEYRVTLPDGSKVWLNASSSIKFPGVFKGNIREVELNGEAYFEIAKNSAMPFRVKANGAQIEVIGTHFNVKAYGNEKRMKTTLVEGSIKITAGNFSHLLKPGQQAILTKGELKVLDNVDIEEQVAWKNGLFIFKDATIEEVMSQVASWYDLNVSFEGKIPEKLLTGKVSRSVNSTEFMNLLNYAGVKFEITGKNIIIKN
jgi:hypothetical protein